MKRFVMVLCGWWLSVTLFAQPAEKYLVSLSTGKTTSLVFPCAVRFVDIGTKDILVQKVEAAENLLLVKAATAGFKATNLSVVTADGRLYAIDAQFKEFPDTSVYYLPGALVPVSFPGELMNLAELERYAGGIADNSKQITGIRSTSWGVQAAVKGIYVKNRVLFFHFALENFSPIDYDVDFIRLYLRDKKKGRRTAVQEIELKPLFTAGKIDEVPAFSKSSAVFVVEKFTIPDNKYFIIEVGEKNGGRHLRLRMNNRKIVRAKILPTLN
jgi:conjugative transposon TraN protein